MDDKQRQQLIERIAREVMAKLKKPAADIRPPIGVCTGDYSKFPELSGKAVGAAGPVGNVVETKITEPALSGIVTATRLQDAIVASKDSVVMIALDARLTPLANDYVREHPEKIRRGTMAGAGSLSSQTGTGGQGEQRGQGGAGGNGAPWLWWIDGRCPVVQTAMQQRRNQIRVMSSTSLVDVVGELANGISNRSLAGGVLFVPTAAKAICYANRCDSIRAMVGTNREAVDEGIGELAANVLVIEYPHHGPKVTNAMLDRMMTVSLNATKVSPIVARDLSELKRL